MRPLTFNNNSIDFIKTYRRFREKYPRKSPKQRPSVYKKNFGASAVRMAEAVVGTYFDAESLKGVKTCLEYVIRSMEIPGYPFPWSDRIKILNDAGRETISLLADSLILTIIAYRIQLNDKSSGIHRICFNEIILGFEWICDWENRCVGISPTQNDLIVTHDIEHLMQFIR